MSTKTFQIRILRWYKKYKRDHLPWRRTKNPYHILLSELMLQQTQVSRVVQKYPEFLRIFPTIHDLARAPLREVLKVWQGMGYNRRALYLKRAAEEIIKTYKGRIPSDTVLLQELPGIGNYTAGAIASFAFNKPVVFLDTNIRKVFIHFFFAKRKKKISDKEILKAARKVLYKNNPRMWHYALMDYGALELAKERRALKKAKAYHKQLPFPGSMRYFRSKIVRHILKKSLGREAIIDILKKDSLFSPRIDILMLLEKLQKERLIVENNKHHYEIAS